MIRILGKLPDTQPIIAVSGGPDSMAILDFLSWREPIVAYMNHGTEHGDEAEEFMRRYCKENGFEIVVGKKSRERNKGESPEEYWRNIRYAFFEGLEGEGPLITCHHLDDQVEQWIFSSLHGYPRLIPYSRGRIIRPFLTTPQSRLLKWCEDKSVPYVTDPSNADVRHSRNRIRHNVIPELLQIQPGLRKVVRKQVETQFNAKAVVKSLSGT